MLRKNLIVICVDSLRQDHVGAYRLDHAARRVSARPGTDGTWLFPGIRAPETPHIDRFMASALGFRNAYPANLPTIPARHELFTGCFGLHNREWEPLLPTDLTLPQILSREGFTCGLVTDTYHYRAPGMNFHRGFQSYEWIRGNEYDPWVAAPTRREVRDYVNEHYDSEWRARIAQYLANTDRFGHGRPEEWFAGQVAETGVRWLRANRERPPFFLWLECFDPHEPWDPPGPFDTYQPVARSEPRLIMPMGGQAADWAQPEDITQLRALYAGEVAYVDAMLGEVFAAITDLDMWSDSVVLLVADHGHPLADHGKFLKGPDRMYSELLKVPLVLWTPEMADGSAGGFCDALVQFPDIAPTLLEILGLKPYTQTMTGRSFASVLAGRAADHRAVAVSGFHKAVDRCLRDRRWSYVVRPEGEPDELYDLANDPGERQNVIDQRPDVAAALVGNVAPQLFARPLRNVKGLMGRYELGSSSLLS